MADARTGAPVAVLGAGAFGTALAVVMASDGRQTMLWGRPGVSMQVLTARPA